MCVEARICSGSFELVAVLPMPRSQGRQRSIGLEKQHRHDDSSARLPLGSHVAQVEPQEVVGILCGRSQQCPACMLA